MSSPFLEKLTGENNNDFQAIVINPASIKELSWIDPNYSKKLMELNCVVPITTNPENLHNTLAQYFDINRYDTIGLSLKNEVFADEYISTISHNPPLNYVYEIIYVDLSDSKFKDYQTQPNELASLLNVNGETIYSSAIILKTKLDTLTDSMVLESVSRQDLERVLHDRVYTKIVTWDESWTEDHVIGDLNEYANIFFDNEKFEKKEFPFLMHNINIWYTTIQNGNNKLFGNLLNQPIDKCIVFTMKSDEFRGNISLDEVKKIINLSTKLDSYNVPSKYQEEKNDEYGRKIIYNKYKILDRTYNEFN